MTTADMDASLLPEESQLLEDFLENIDDLVILATPEGRIIYVNRAWREKLGYSLEEIGGINAHDVLHPMHQAQVAANESKLRSGETLRDIERTFVAKDGRQFIVEGFLNYCIKDGRAQYARAVFRDVTERKKAERMKDELIAMATHELRSPLTAIIGALEMAKRHPDTTPKMSEIALRNSQFMLDLINAYLDLEKLESGGAPFSGAPMELPAFVETVLEANRSLRSGVTLTLEARAPGVKVKADAARLRQVLTNLLSNAVKFSPPEGVVKVSIARRDSTVRVSVSDQGPGIPEGFRTRIFGRFEQAEGHKKGGTGLGLAIAKAIVERHGGKIGFETGSAGTAFYFDLPAVS